MQFLQLPSPSDNCSMTASVEGFGDEVIQCLCALFIVSLTVLLWISTYVPERQQLFGGAFIIFEQRRAARRRTNRRIPFTAVDSTSEDSSTDTDPENTSIQTNSTLNNDNPENKSENSATSENNVTETEPTNGSSQSANNAINNPQTYEDTIKIRLKYINDNCRLVEGRLQENVGVFKRRHFSRELSSNKTVRLIFQGKMMNNEEASLRSFGLHDNCVLHCLIHHPRSLANARRNRNPVNPVNHDTIEQPVQNTPVVQIQPEPVFRRWNLATCCFVAVAITLSLLWFSRYQFSSLFSYTSTCTLIVMTLIFIFNVFLTYLIHSEVQQPRLGYQTPR